MINTLLQQMDKLIRPDRAEQLAKEHGWRKRRGKILAFEFLFSAVGQASALELTLNAQASSFTEPVTRQAVDQRYNAPAVQFFQAAFQECLATHLAEKATSAMTQMLAQKFRAIRLFDSTHCPCSDALAQLFPASGGGGGKAGLKVLLSYDYGASQLHPLAVLPGKCSDQGLAGKACQQVGASELGIFDKGFYQAQALRQVQARGGYFLLPWHQGVSVWELEAAGPGRTPIAVAAHLKASSQSCEEWSGVELGQTPESRLGPVRLIAYRLAEPNANRRRAQLREKCRTHGRQPTEQALELAGWLILLTNAPKALLPTAAASYVYRIRWQVELIFKQWKSVLRLDVLPSQNAFRVQCELWARLLTALLTFVWHQHTNAACLKLHQCEISFSKVAKLWQQQGQSLVRARFGDRAGIESEFRKLWKRILKLALKERQPSRPTTWENLCSHWLEVLPT